MRSLLSMQRLYKFSDLLAPYLAIAAMFFLSYGLLAGLFIAPVDAVQKEAMRIIYIHVPCAIISLSIYTIIGISSFIYLVWKIKAADIIAKASAPFGALITLLALLTGALWGKPMWGTWWVWDARLTSELILLFLYIGYIGLRNAIPEPRAQASLSAIVAVVGLVDIPIVHFSVDWWHTLHQGASITKFAKPSIDIGILYPLLSVILGMYLVYMLLVCLNIKYEILQRETNAKWIGTLLGST